MDPTWLINKVIGFRSNTAFVHLEGTVEEIESMVFPHPTISEALFESAAAWMGNGIHYN